MKVIKLKNQHGDQPSLLVTGGKLRVVGTLHLGDTIQIADKTSMMVLIDYLEKEVRRVTE